MLPKQPEPKIQWCILRCMDGSTMWIHGPSKPSLCITQKMVFRRPPSPGEARGPIVLEIRSFGFVRKMQENACFYREVSREEEVLNP